MHQGDVTQRKKIFKCGRKKRREIAQKHGGENLTRAEGEKLSGRQIKRGE